MTRSTLLLLWLERALLAVGIVLGAWCGMTLIEARYYKMMPVPSPAPVRSLPGDRGSLNPPRTAIARGEWVARLEAPTIGLAATVLEGSDDRTLGRAAGHIEETAFPGEPGNVGIAGHRDTTFRPLRDLKVGDRLRVTTADRILEYRVASTAIVRPEDVHVLDPTPQPTLTLVTCYPFTYVGNAPKRYIVQARLVSETSRAGAGGSEQAGAPGAAGRAGRAGAGGAAQESQKDRRARSAEL
jgi:sortase A